jgi:translation elongation factor EF-Tu-like GTPase
MMQQTSSKPRITLRLKMLPELQGGRHASFTEGYRPYLKTDDERLLAVTATNCPRPVAPGDEVDVEFELDYYPALDYSRLTSEAEVIVCEGPRTVARGVVIKGLSIEH